MTSSIDLRPKFGIAFSSDSDFCTQLADRLDAGALEAVVRADAELELLDQDVVHARRARRRAAAAVAAADGAAPAPIRRRRRPRAAPRRARRR